MLLIDTNILLDVVEDIPPWADWSIAQLQRQSKVHELTVNPVIYAEASPAFESSAQLDNRLDEMEMKYRDLPREAMFLAGHVHRRYRQAGGAREQLLADFIIGAHAMVLGCGILTRDARRYRRYFPRVPLVTP
jgi:predicted nucleic acid-binding protein